jgi:hypothetical protein
MLKTFTDVTPTPGIMASDKNNITAGTVRQVLSMSIKDALIRENRKSCSVGTTEEHLCLSNNACCLESAWNGVNHLHVTVLKTPSRRLAAMEATHTPGLQSPLASPIQALATDINPLKRRNSTIPTEYSMVKTVAREPTPRYRLNENVLITCIWMCNCMSTQRAASSNPVLLALR